VKVKLLKTFKHL